MSRMEMSPSLGHVARAAGAPPSSATPRTGQRWWQAARARGAGAPGAPGSGVAFAALMAFIIVSLISPQPIVPALEPFRLALLTGASAVVALLRDAFLRGRPLLTPSRETWVAASLAVLGNLSVAVFFLPGGRAMLLPHFFQTVVAFWLLG